METNAQRMPGCGSPVEEFVDTSVTEEADDMTLCCSRALKISGIMLDKLATQT